MSEHMGQGTRNPTVPSGGMGRYDEPLGRPWLPYMDGPAIDTAMSVPDSRKKCVFIDVAPRATFLVRAPDGVTAYTIHYGRWLDAPKNHGSALSMWIETGTVSVTGVTAGALKETPAFETETDAVGCYIAGITGTVTPGQSFALWSRGLPKP